MYPPEPDGLAGNEDCGQMSAWYIMSALGLYSVDPVSTNYVFGSPLLDKAEIELAGGRKLVIQTINNGPNHPYIQSVQWNGQPWTKSWISAGISHVRYAKHAVRCRLRRSAAFIWHAGQ
jgi:putative alpha-1,2-mannosidase